MSHTSLVPGKTDGVAVPAGYVGEVLQSSNYNYVNFVGTTGEWTDVASITFTAGIWNVYGMVDIIRNAATFTLVDGPLVGLGTAAGNNDPQGFNGIRHGLTGLNLNTSFGVLSASVQATIICNGTNIQIANRGSTATTILRLKAYIGTWSAGTPQARCIFYAVRIA